MNICSSAEIIPRTPAVAGRLLPAFRRPVGVCPVPSTFVEFDGRVLQPFVGLLRPAQEQDFLVARDTGLPIRAVQPDTDQPDDLTLLLGFLVHVASSRERFLAWVALTYYK